MRSKLVSTEDGILLLVAVVALIAVEVVLGASLSVDEAMATCCIHKLFLFLLGLLLLLLCCCSVSESGEGAPHDDKSETAVERKGK